MRWMWASMAGELKVGRTDGSGKMSAWGTTRTRGLERSSHTGTWPLVTMNTRRTQGA